MQDIYSNYYKKYAPNIIHFSKNRNYETSFSDICHVKSVNNKQWG